MNTRRRDHKNRVLRPRESQQLDGRYRYTYYSNGKRKIKDIKISDAKMWFVELQNGGRGHSSINNIRGVARPAFRWR